MSEVNARAARLQVITAFSAVYIVWGSTYLAILYAIETIPAWTLTSIRSIIAGLIMGALARFKRETPLEPSQRKNAYLSGTLLIIANGVVCIVERWVPSGITAVVIGAMPIWIMLFGWSFFGHGRPSLQKCAGAIVGLIGVGLIAIDQKNSSQSSFALYGVLILFTSSWIWAVGTLVQRRASKVVSGFRYSQTQLIVGGLATGLLSLVFEHPWQIPVSSVSLHSWLALGYLIVFGSVIGFTAFSWLGRNVQPHLMSTYALVNPVIAVWLGWIIAGEQFNPLFLVSTLLVIGGLMLLMAPPLRRGRVVAPAKTS